MGCAPMSYVLWKEFMAVDPKAPKWFNRDRFVLSAGHGSMLNYSLLHLMGYDSVGVSPPPRLLLLPQPLLSVPRCSHRRSVPCPVCRVITPASSLTQGPAPTTSNTTQQIEDLKQFRQWGSKTPGHPENFLTEGVEVTTGPLGQGIANAVGLAAAEAHLAARFNKPDAKLVDHYT